MNIQGKLQPPSLREQVPLTSNVGLIAGIVMATVGFIAIFVYYL